MSLSNLFVPNNFSIYTGNLTTAGNIINTGSNESNNLILDATSNQITVGAPTMQTTVNFVQPSSNITLTMPNTTDTLVGRSTTDTLSNKRFSNQVVLGNFSSQLVLQPGLSGPQVILSTGTPSANRTYSFYDPGANVNFMLGIPQIISTSSATTLTQLQSGAKIFLSSTVAYNITLPTNPTIGTNYKFIVATALGTFANITIITNPQASVFALSPTTGNAVSATPYTAQTSVSVKYTSNIGDYVEVIWSGAIWICSSATFANNSIVCP